MTDHIPFINRKYTSNLLKSFLKKRGRTASLVFLRGRRRIGKSTLLKQICSESKMNPFYFTGAEDESDKKAQLRWIKEWSKINTKTALLKYSSSQLNWTDIFEELYLFAKNHSSKEIAIIIDEIQWVAKAKSGFIGLLKEAWLKLEHCSNLKFIICGSSNRFFHMFTGGEEQILRGLSTHNDIWLYDIPLEELKSSFGQDWDLEEATFAYMCLGGVPYYWQQFPEKFSFIKSFNDLAFTNSTILLKEVSEILRLDFNKAGVETAQEILSAINIMGSDFTTLSKKTRLPLSTLSDLLEKLVEYQLVYTKRFYLANKLKNQRGSIYFLKDPYLNFYISILKPMKRKILQNQDQLLFSHILRSKSGFYLDSFSGYAFERFIQNLLEKEVDRKESLFSNLGIKDLDYKVGTFHDAKAQIDLVLFESSDRNLYLIECRWSHNQKLIKECITSLKMKSQFFKEKKQLAVLTNCKKTKELHFFSKNHGVKLLDLREIVTR